MWLCNMLVVAGLINLNTVRFISVYVFCVDGQNDFEIV